MGLISHKRYYRVFGIRLSKIDSVMLKMLLQSLPQQLIGTSESLSEVLYAIVPTWRAAGIAWVMLYGKLCHNNNAVVDDDVAFGYDH